MLAFALRDAPESLDAKREPLSPQAPSTEAEYYEGDPVLLSLNSGRKETGAYYTKQFAVDWILDHALTPALDEHLERVAVLYNSGDVDQAGKALLDFSVVDPACGSGHFLVSACERVAGRFLDFLEQCPLPYVTSHLEDLRHAATEAMQHDPGGLVHLSDLKLLQRAVASHCIYGVDINPLSAELARLSLWIKTFLPGLPLQALNGQIISGNLLISACDIESVNEHLRQIITQQGRLFKPAMARAADDYEISRSNFQRDADEVHRVEQERHEAQERLRPLRRQLDAALAVTLGYAAPVNPAKRKRRSAANGPIVLEADSLEELSRIMGMGEDATANRHQEARFYRSDVPTDHPGRRIYDRLRALDEYERHPTHPQIEFPHVYGSTRPSGAAPGFDCVVGNPPWEKVKADQKVWWGQHLPGARALGTEERKRKQAALSASRLDLKEDFERYAERKDLMKAALRAVWPDMGAGDTDLHKAFAWCNLTISREGGHVGVVLPRTAVSDVGMRTWRERILTGGGCISPPDSSSDPHQPQGLGIPRSPQLLHSRSGGLPVLSVVTCLNNKHWCFEGVDGRYTICFVAATSRAPRSEPWGHL